MDDPIERYLRELADELLVSGRERARILAEAEDHLRESEQALIEDGMRIEEAGAQAIAWFGDASEAGARFNRTSLRAQLHGVPWYIAVFVGAGFLTMGASSLLSSLLSMSFGARSAGAAAFPGREHQGGGAPREARGFEEFIGSFADGAALGGLMLGGTWLLRNSVRRRNGERGARARMAFGLLALAAFGTTGLLLIPLGVWQIVRYPGTGGGYWLASGLAAIGALLVYAAWTTWDVQARASTAAATR